MEYSLQRIDTRREREQFAPTAKDSYIEKQVHRNILLTKLDDLVNWIPARLTAVLITAGCFFVPGASPSSAWKAARRDAGGHKSPNAGWPEAAMAGALGFALGGPREYDGETVDLPTMGDGRRQLRASDVLRSVALYKAMLNVTLVLVIVIALLRMAGHF